ncbi:MAG: hypothetical protein ACYST9_04890 [Planctomycetota bacterium]|jgi:hypothetical protein
MNSPASPLRYLAKTYANDLISREQYVLIRAQLLKKLQSKGFIGDDDLQNFIKLAQGRADKPRTEKSYSSTDWIIIALGIAAALVLGLVLYS